MSRFRCSRQGRRVVDLPAAMRLIPTAQYQREGFALFQEEALSSVLQTRIGLNILVGVRDWLMFTSLFSEAGLCNAQSSGASQIGQYVLHDFSAATQPHFMRCLSLVGDQATQRSLGLQQATICKEVFLGLSFILDCL